MSLIDSLIKEGWLKTPRIIEAFRAIKREDFMPLDMRDLAESNEAFPIGFGQTISQPLTVAFMLEHLQPQPGDKILDIGAGSGWTTALLAHIVGKQGKIIAIEVIPELKEFGGKNVSKYNFIEKRIVKFICADGSKGYPNFAACPELAEGFDKILASASAEKLPQEWKEQLKNGGRLVTPIASSIWLFIKKSSTEFEEREFPGFAFVPLIESHLKNKNY
jgi:protein-L-isoaspartate(D-aspartate) O-methyltransferase